MRSGVPRKMVDIPTLSAVIAAASVVATSIFAASQLRHFVKNRNTELVMRLYSDFGKKEFQESLHQLMTTEIKKNNEDYAKKLNQLEITTNALGVIVFFEGIGVLVHRKLADINLIYDLIGGSITVTYQKLQPLIEGYRKQTNQPEFCEWFEHLYNQIQQKEKTKSA